MSSYSDPPEDGPLFRAILRSLENRAHSLRKSVKNLLSATTASLSALQVSYCTLKMSELL